MLKTAYARAEELGGDANVYGDKFVDGTYVVYVLPEKPGVYDEGLGEEAAPEVAPGDGGGGETGSLRGGKDARKARPLRLGRNGSSAAQT